MCVCARLCGPPAWVRGGGARVNDVAVNDENMRLTMADFIDGKAKISAGKKRHAMLVAS